MLHIYAVATSFERLYVVSADQAMALFGALPVQALQQKATRADQLQGEIWRLFLFAMLLFLLAEGWLILPAVRAPEPVLGRKSTTPAPAT